MGLADYFKGPEHKANATRLEAELQAHKQQSHAEIHALNAKYNVLEAQVREIGLLDLLVVQKQIQAEEAQLASIRAQVATAQSDLKAAGCQLRAVQQQILGAEDTVLLESFALYEPKYQFTNSIDYKNRLSEIREEQKQTARGLSAEVDAWDNHAVQLTKAQWKKLRKDVLKLALRSFNSESEYCVDNVKFSNLEKMEERIRRSFESCNKLLSAIDAWWKDIVLERKLQELYLAHEYQRKRQEEKEIARQAREDQREQEKLEKEIREARAKIEKERRHFTSALQKLQLRLGAANDQQERDELQSRIDQLSSQNKKLDDEEKLLDYREQNARAGYVYVISNVGAFGDGIYKIGMTRRLEPMDRVDELGDASVPFRFDVHALVFSDNAPALEAKLHLHFAAGRLNKVNGRKEFFRADLKDIETVIRTNYDAVVEVVHAAPAEQYRESLRLAMPLESIETSERIAL
ncbi:hypothetical protein CTTA_3481 [Comamonas testosteroni]|uniref:Bacteriophage T5 Orf172 DNA-binding domain-containing protein n=1 Tax=Comamonas testosteroni TaxID=285 RepID=A0A5A7MFJ1_COMTE|nr:DUF4041 domain-containing protein [Comamonas testosteroni]GEQ76476.1 hypothetical protein CTTA_3481 [Comamonas testosteroni]